MTTKPVAAGTYLIKSMMPTQESKDNYDKEMILDKSGMSNLINMLIKHGGDKGFETINDLAHMFFNSATAMGASTPLHDYDNDSEERVAQFSEFESKVRTIVNSKLTPKEKAVKLDILAQGTRKVMNASNLKYLVGRGSIAAKMAQSGARGNMDQLGMGTGTPLMAYDVRGYPIPVAIKHSFAEGLSPAEFYAMSYGGRASTVLTQLSTEKPGALFKKLMPSVFHEVVTMSDCGTKNGIMIPTTDAKAIIGRYEARTNRLVDEAEYRQIKDQKFIKIRSAMTCEAHEGICQKCYGIAANGKLPGIGENVGVIAAQSVSEVLTQAMLATKHGGGVSGGQKNIYEEANNLLSNPAEKFQDESTMATINGKVSAIKQTALKDWEVFVNDKPHFVSREQEPNVKVGDNVRTGDPLSTGTLNPRKLVALKGAGAGRLYLSAQLRDVYGKKAAGLDPRHFEIIAKNMIKHVEVEDPGESTFLPGQKLDVSHVLKFLRKDQKEVPISEALGKTVASGILELTPGTILNSNHIDDLKKAGVDKVSISASGLKIRPLVPGLQTGKLLDKNWISNLSFSRLKHTILEAAATGLESEQHSVDPITPYVLGTEFGEGDKGRY